MYNSTRDSRLLWQAQSTLTIQRMDGALEESILTHDMNILNSPGPTESVAIYNQTTMLTTVFSNVTDTPLIEPPFCQSILFKTIGDSYYNIRIWDVAILIPNVLFFLYFLAKFPGSVAVLRRNNSAIFTVIFALVFIANCISILRCIISMAVNATLDINIPDRIMWLVLKFFLLATELAVVTFCILFGHHDTRTSIRRVIAVTFTISLLYSTLQGVLEFQYANDKFHNIPTGYTVLTLFGHGGLIFWFVSSVCLFLIYISIYMLPFTRLSRRFALPTRKSFYWYCLLLASVDAAQAIGSMLLRCEVMQGMCVVDVTAYLYFMGFSLLVYVTFLHSFLSSTQPTIQFSYRRHADEGDDFILPRNGASDSSGHPNLYEGAANGGVDGATDDLGVTDSYDSTQFNTIGGSLVFTANLPDVSINYGMYGGVTPGMGTTKA